MHSLLSFGGSTGEASMGSILNCPAYGDRSLYHFADNSATALGSIPLFVDEGEGETEVLSRGSEGGIATPTEVSLSDGCSLHNVDVVGITVSFVSVVAVAVGGPRAAAVFGDFDLWVRLCWREGALWHTASPPPPESRAKYVHTSNSISVSQENKLDEQRRFRHSCAIPQRTLLKQSVPMQCPWRCLHVAYPQLQEIVQHALRGLHAGQLAGGPVRQWQHLQRIHNNYVTEMTIVKLLPRCANGYQDIVPCKSFSVVHSRTQREICALLYHFNHRTKGRRWRRMH
eukprot:m.1160826 g.1160826  ORF g.1160826 m.1160826 type:complete len:285 (+) comp24501_c0_seq96:3319-4173(+)